MKLVEIVNDLQTYINGLQGIIDRIDADHKAEIEEYKRRNVSYGSSVETNYSSKVVPLRMKKQNLERILGELQNVDGLDENIPTNKDDKDKN